MTILDSILTNEVLKGFSSERIQLFASLRGINWREEANISSLDSVELLTADCYREMIVHPDFTEGGLTMTFDRGALQRYIDEVANRYDDERLKGQSNQGISSITDKTDEW
jgi:hypothetical protein